jgi:putative transposase
MAIIGFATEYGRYGYRRITALLRRDGWVVNHKRVERIRRQEGLKVPRKQPKRSRLWLTAGSCVRLRPCIKKIIFLREKLRGGGANYLRFTWLRPVFFLYFQGK